MRIPQALSYSSLSLFEKDKDEHYTKYLADHRPARVPQERPAAAGSAFDAYVKSTLDYDLFGPHANPAFEFGAIFESQVEPHNRDWARDAGLYIFKAYVASGAYKDILKLLGQSIEPPRFEFTVEGLIGGTVPFLGKPDCRFVLPGPVHVVHDWKVSGFCSKYPQSPAKHYLMCRDGFTPADAKPSRGAGNSHPAYAPYDHHGLTIHAGWMEHTSDDWADQLTTYGWLLGEEPGDENVVLSVDQIVAKPAKEPAANPLLRVAQFHARVSRAHQLRLMERVQFAWKAISTGHIFTDLSRDENDKKCAELEQQCIAMVSNGSAADDFFNQCVRPAYRG